MQILRILLATFIILLGTLAIVYLFSFYIQWASGRYSFFAYLLKRKMIRLGMVEVNDFEEFKRLDHYFQSDFRILKRRTLYKNPQCDEYFVFDLFWQNRSCLFFYKTYSFKLKEKDSAVESKAVTI